MLFLRTVILGAVLVVPVACGDDDGTPPPADAAAGSDAAMDASSPVDGAPSPDGAPADDGGRLPDGGGVDAGPALGGGTVTVSWSPRGGGRFSSSATACFWDAGQDPQGLPCVTGALHSACTRADVGVCEVTRCPLVVPPSAPPFSHAGAVTFEGVTGGPLVAMPDGSGVYAPVNGAAQLWSRDDMLTITAAGDTVPAFSSMLAGPGGVTLRSPNLARMLNIDRSAARRFRWTNGGSGSLMSIILRSADASGSVEIACNFPIEDRSGDVPPEALGMLLPGMGSITAITLQTEIVMTATHQVEVAAFALADRGDGFSASQNATFSP